MKQSRALIVVALIFMVWLVLAYLIPRAGDPSAQLVQPSPEIRAVPSAEPAPPLPFDIAEQAIDDRSAYQRHQDSWALHKLTEHDLRATSNNIDGWEFTVMQGIMLARIWASEETHVLRPDTEVGKGTGGKPSLGCRLIAHVVRNNRGRLLVRETREPVSGWFEIMRELSPHVTGKLEPNRPRQRWTSTLPVVGNEQPSGWDPDRDGSWHIYADNWVKLREAAVRMWTTQQLGSVPGGGRVMSWDSAGVMSTRKRLCRLLDTEGAVLGSHNWFWGWEGDSACEGSTSKTVKVAAVLAGMEALAGVETPNPGQP